MPGAIVNALYASSFFNIHNNSVKKGLSSSLLMRKLRLREVQQVCCKAQNPSSDSLRQERNLLPQGIQWRIETASYGMDRDASGSLT